MQLYSACSSSLSEEDSQDRDDLVRWEEKMVEEILDSKSSPSKEDARCLVKIAEYHPDQNYLAKYVRITQFL